MQNIAEMFRNIFGIYTFWGIVLQSVKWQSEVKMVQNTFELFLHFKSVLLRYLIALGEHCWLTIKCIEKKLVYCMVHKTC